MRRFSFTFFVWPVARGRDATIALAFTSVSVNSGSNCGTPALTEKVLTVAHTAWSVSYEMSQLRSEKAYVNKHRRDEIRYTKCHGIECGAWSLAHS